MDKSNQFSHPNFAESALLAKANRNLGIIKWYKAQNEETCLNIRMLYAGHLNCPLCEVTEDMLDPDDLDFIWSLFEKQIRAFSS